MFYKSDYSKSELAQIQIEMLYLHSHVWPTHCHITTVILICLQSKCSILLKRFARYTADHNEHLSMALNQKYSFSGLVLGIV